MQGLIGSLSLVGVSGFAIIGAIVLVLFASIGINLLSRSRYASLERDLSQHTRPDRLLTHRVLNRIMTDAREAVERHGQDANTQALIEHHVQDELGGLLLGERFVRSAVGLVIILGLVGTFYGLTLSIGQLVTLVSGDGSQTANVAESVTLGLTQSLSGMAVAFSTSLFGVAAGIVLTVFGIFFNITDRRTAFMVTLEAHLDRVLITQGGAAERGRGGAGAAQLEHVMALLGQSVAGLDGAVAQFEAALQTFAANTRDFHEFNLHLKDNVQRMSLGFGDVSEALRAHASALGTRGAR